MSEIFANSLLAGVIENALYVAGGLLLLIFVGLIVMIVKCWKKVEQGSALIVTGGAVPTFHFSKAIVWPLIRQAEIVDISLKRIEIYHYGPGALICRDHVRADVKACFCLCVQPTAGDVLRVARLVGTARASDPTILRDLFEVRFDEALKAAAKEADFVELVESRERFKERVLEIIGKDLHGYTMVEASIDHVERTPDDGPVESSEPANT